MLSASFVLATLAANAAFNASLAPGIVHVANRFFRQRTRLVMDLTDSEELFLNEALKGHNIPVLVLRPPLPPMQEWSQTIGAKCDMIVMMNNRTKDITGEEWLSLRWNPGGRMLLIVEGNQFYARRLISSFWRRSKTNNVVVAIMEKDSIKFYGWTPYNPGECDRVENVILVDEWKNGKLVANSVIYTHEVTNLNGCPLKVTTNDVTPYVMNNHKEGIEIKMLNILEKHINFRSNFVDIPRGEQFFLAKSFNGTHFNFHGAFRMLYLQETDIVFGGTTGQADRFEGSLPLYPHAFERIIWVGPAPRVIPQYQNMYIVLSGPIWILLGVTVVVGICGVLVTNDPRIPDFTTSFFYVLCLLMTSMPTFRPKKWHLRIITFLLIYLAIHMLVAYQSSLIIILTATLTEEPYKHVSELSRDGLKCGLYTAGVRLLQAAEDHETLPKNCTSIYNMGDFLNRIAWNRSDFFLFPSTPLSFLLRNAYKDDDGRNLLRPLDEPFIVLPIQLFLSPGSPLAGIFNLKIQQTFEVGIVDFWKKKTQNLQSSHFYSHFRSFNSGHAAVDDHMKEFMDKDALQPLSRKHLIGPFIALTLFLAISLAIFVCEILIWFIKKKTKKTTKIEKRKKRRILLVHPDTFVKQENIAVN